MTHEQIQAMKQQNWWPAYERNLKEYFSQWNVRKSTEEWLLECTLDSTINDAFIWDKTPEGFDYWCEVSCDFPDCLSRTGPQPDPDRWTDPFLVTVRKHYEKFL